VVVVAVVLVLVAAVLVVAAVLMLAWLGLRPDLMAGQPHPMFLLRCGTLAVLGLVSVAAVRVNANLAANISFNESVIH
jgi:hypothetical protein